MLWINLSFFRLWNYKLQVKTMGWTYFSPFSCLFLPFSRSLDEIDREISRKHILTCIVAVSVVVFQALQRTIHVRATVIRIHRQRRNLTAFCSSVVKYTRTHFPVSYHANLQGDTHYTVRCRHNSVNFLVNPHKRHPISRPLGLLWGFTLIYTLRR